MAQNVYTVKQVNAYIKNIFTQDYMLNRIYVKGEVSNCKYHTSGHIYFSLKDESGTIACVMFAGQRGGLSFRMKEGQQVIVLGSVNVYERSGSYQLYAKEIRSDGDGALYERFQMLKRELEEMGMFAPEYKKAIPAYAKRIGVVTAPTGAAVRDIMNIAARRNPYVQLILYPAQVQGAGAKESIVRGIHLLQKTGVDVMIVGRGGGSIEDLWAFNEEEVARAIFECQIPVISAVGHETDTTIADYVADLRAPTPSAAAELAVSDHRQTQIRMQEYELRLKRLLAQKTETARQKVREYRMRLRYLHPKSRLMERQQRLAELEDSLRRLMEGKVRDSRHRLAIYMEAMKGLSPMEKLNHGYSYVENEEGNVVRSIRQVKEKLDIYVTDGVIRAAVESVREVRYGREDG
ncbi:MAG: exodeoxyribonuclease VII large subunit [Dorea sp.]|jgi:exodeoxyribonuclease VII large subunit|nr:exodeoxyribonuclease VII large subunit [Dorea sp.]